MLSISNTVMLAPNCAERSNLFKPLGINEVDDVMNEWNEYVAKQREVDLEKLIQEEKLKPEETRRFLENAFREGEVKTVGTDIDKMMPPVSRFGGGNRTEKKQTIIEKIKAFFEKYFGIGRSFKASEEDKQQELS